MGEKKLISAIDIGTTKIVATIAELIDENTIVIKGFGETKSIGVNKGMVVNINKTIESINEAIGKAEEMSGLKLNDITVGIASHHIKSKKETASIKFDDDNHTLTYDDIQQLNEKVKEIELPLGEEVIGVYNLSMFLDNTKITTESVGLTGHILKGNFNLITGKRASSSNIKKCITDLGKNINKLILEPIASSYAVLTPRERKLGVALIDIGGGTSDLAIFKNDAMVFSAVIPFAGNNITKDISAMFKILENQAEELKIKFGRALPESAEINNHVSIKISPEKSINISEYNLSTVIRARILEILSIIENKIIMSGLKNEISAGIVITGGGSLLKDLKQIAKIVFPYADVRIGNPSLNNLQYNFDIDVENPKYSTIIGLIEVIKEDIENIKKKESLNVNKTNNNDFDDDEDNLNRAKNKTNSLKNIFKNFFNPEGEDKNFDDDNDIDE